MTVIVVKKKALEKCVNKHDINFSKRETKKKHLGQIIVLLNVVILSSAEFSTFTVEDSSPCVLNFLLFLSKTGRKNFIEILKNADALKIRKIYHFTHA